MINNVTLVGRLVAPPELRKTPNNVSSLQGTLAVNRNFKNENGEREVDFINFQAWRGTADIIAQYCSKGSLLKINYNIHLNFLISSNTQDFHAFCIATIPAVKQCPNGHFFI